MKKKFESAFERHEETSELYSRQLGDYSKLYKKHNNVSLPPLLRCGNKTQPMQLKRQLIDPVQVLAQVDEATKPVALPATKFCNRLLAVFINIFTLRSTFNDETV